jgi:phosphate transport system substrate-binding protein
LHEERQVLTNISVSRFVLRLAAATVAALTALTVSEPSHAQSVVLRSSDGSVTVAGPLIRFDGNTYTIRSAANGELNLSISNFSCISGACPSPNAFGIHGSNTIGAELMPRLIEAYAKSRGEQVKISNGASPEVSEIKVLGAEGTNRATIDLQAHGSGTATPGLISGRALIGMSSRPLNAAELEQLAQKGLGDMNSPENEHVVGLDGIIVIVSPRNPVTKLTLRQLQDIFSGAVSDWSQVGATPGKVNVYARDARSGTFDTFKSLVLDPGKQKIAGSAQRFESSNELSDLVASDPRAIGFVGFAYLRNARALTLVNECGMSFAPTTFDVKTEEYPLSRRLFLYSGKVPAESFAAGLLDFSASQYAHAIVSDSGFIDRELEIQSGQRQSNRMANIQSAGEPKESADKQLATLTQDLQATSRISTTMRFRFNSTQLDSKALKDVDILGRFLQFMKETKSDRKLLLVGFADSIGTMDKNIALSIARANAVRQAILSRFQDRQYAKMIEVRGYGPRLAAACNESEFGQNKNRRVEVWLK